MDEESEQRERFEQMGEEAVRLRVLTPTGFNTTNQRFAIKWLEKKFEESKRRSEAAQAEQNRTARTAKTAAIVAAIASIISIIISTLAWIYPVH